MKNKKVLFLILLISSISFAVGCSSKVNEDPETETNHVNKESNSSELDYSDYEAMKKEEDIIGKSNKDFKEDITESEPIYVSESTIFGIGDEKDRISTWKAITITEHIDIEEYALSYKKENMKEDELHFIINSSNDTNTMIDVYDDIIYIKIKEYQHRGEYDSKILSGGIPFKSFCIYPDGDIQKLKTD